MNIQKKNNQKRLLEALDYVDVKYVGELVGGLRLPKNGTAEPSAKKSFRESIKYAVLIAACALLLGTAIPLVGTVVGNITAGRAAAGSVIPETEQNSLYQLEEDMQVKEQTGDAFDGSPLFAVMNTDGVCEVYTVDGKKLDICVCKQDACICYPTDRKSLTVCGSQVFWLVHNTESDSMAACAFDYSDPDNPKYVLYGLFPLYHKESWYDYSAINGTSYFLVYSKNDEAEHQGLSIWDLSFLFDENEGYAVSQYSAYGDLKDSAKLLYVGKPSVYIRDIYFGITDEAGAVTQIVLITKKTVDRKQELLYKDVMDVSDGALAESRVFLDVAEDGGVHFFREEKDGKSENGYSLYQYIYREGEEVTKVLRAKNVSDYILSDGYIYYTADESGKIYRLPAFELDYKPMTAVDLGEAYEGVTFLYGADGGIAVSAEKKSGEELIPVTLLIGDNGNGTVVTELAGSTAD